MTRTKIALTVLIALLIIAACYAAFFYGLATVINAGPPCMACW